MNQFYKTVILVSLALTALILFTHTPSSVDARTNTTFNDSARFVNSQINPNCEIVDSTPQDANFANDFLNRISSQRASIPVRSLAGAQWAADRIAQAIAADPSILSNTSIMIDDCPLTDFLTANIVDGRFPSVQLLSIGYDSANPFVSADDFYNNLIINNGSLLQQLEDPDQIREMGVGYAQVGEGDHYAVFVPLLSEERNGFTIPSAHYTPNTIFFPDDNPTYDGCDGVPTSTVDAFGQAFSQLENRINNLRSSSDQLNQGNAEIAQILHKAAQYLAEDMAHDYYILQDAFYTPYLDSPFDTDNYIVDRNNDGNLIAACAITDFIRDYFANAGYTAPVFNYITLDNNIRSVDEAYALLQTVSWLSDPLYEYIGIGYAEGESGSGRFALIISASPDAAAPISTPPPMSTPDPTPIPIPTGVLPTPSHIPEGQGGTSSIACNPSNGVGGLLDLSGNPIMPGDTAITTISGRPVTIMVGDGYDPANPTILTFYLHGDEGNHEAHDSSKYVGGHVEQIVKENGWIYVAPQAPRRPIPTTEPGDLPIFLQGDWYPWYGGVRPFDLDRQEAQENADLLKEILLEMRNRYNVCQNMSLGATVSGGSYFYDGLFFPMNGAQLPAFVNLHCGSSGIDNVDASGPDSVTAWETSGYYSALQAMAADLDIVNQTELAYVIGELDDRAVVWPNIWHALNTYDALGFNLQRKSIENVGHCAYDVQSEIASYWAEKFALIEPYLPVPIDNGVPEPTGQPDQFEMDNTCLEAAEISTNGIVQERSFHDFGDKDWVKFDVEAGKRYSVFGNVPLESSADLVVEVFHECEGRTEVEQGHAFAPGVRIDFPAHADTTYYLNIYNNYASRFGDDVAYALSVREIPENPPQSAVIIVAGTYEGILQDNIHHVTNNVYKLYRQKGHTGTRIHYLANDFTLDPMRTGEQVISGDATAANLQDAITSWAVNRVDEDQALTLYMMSHGDYDRFFLDGEDEVVTPAQLGNWLTTLEGVVGNVPINVVIDACHSGSFIDSENSISKPGRIVITSAERNERAWASKHGAIFSDFFTSAIHNNDTLYEAFNKASNSAKGTWLSQTPLLDGNGNGTPNEADDISYASVRGFEHAGSFSLRKWEPYIADLRPVTQGFDTQATLVARVMDDSDGTVAPDDDIINVWAVLYPPSYTPPPEDGTELVAESQSIVSLAEQNRMYTGQFCPDEVGTWQAVVYAEDGDGLVSQPKTITFDITEMGGCTLLAVGTTVVTTTIFPLTLLIFTVLFAITNVGVTKRM